MGSTAHYEFLGKRHKEKKTEKKINNEQQMVEKLQVTR